MFRVSHKGEGIDDADTVEGAREVFVKDLPHFNRGWGNDSRPERPSSSGIFRGGDTCGFAFAVESRN